MLCLIEIMLSLLVRICFQFREEALDHFVCSNFCVIKFSALLFLSQQVFSMVKILNLKGCLG